MTQRPRKVVGQLDRFYHFSSHYRLVCLPLFLFQLIPPSSSGGFPRRRWELLNPPLPCTKGQVLGALALQ